MQETVHKQQGLLQPGDDCQAKSSQELVGASQGAGWRLECIKSHHTHVCPWKFHVPSVRNWAEEIKKVTVAQRSKVFFRDESNVSISFGNHLPRDGRGAESKLLEVQCDVSTVRDDLLPS